MPRRGETEINDSKARPAHHCLNCGYSRYGLANQTPCPECGQPDNFESQRTECLALARNIPRLVWRFATLRRPPVGWWEVFDDADASPCSWRKAWIVLLAAVLLLWAFLLLGTVVGVEGTTRTYYYKAADPDRTPVAEIRSDRLWIGLPACEILYNEWLTPRVPASQPSWAKTTEYRQELKFVFLDKLWHWDGLLISALLTAPYLIASWVVLRYVWLYAMMARGMGDVRRAAVRRAANCLSIIWISHLLWSCLASFLGFFWLLASPFGSTIRSAHSGCTIPCIAALLLYPTIAWSRTLAADRNRRVFPMRALAMFLLIPATLLSWALVPLVAWAVWAIAA